ncbi:MAG: conjugative transfer system coupling protein TraD [Nitrospirae bacterium]|nr:conjugative transfer system coupling protein TraD [Nitrospirota bacterium]
MKAQVFGTIIATVFLLYAFRFPSPWNIVWSVIAGYYLYRYINGIITERFDIKALKGTGSFTISYRDLPADKLFIGKGFLWTPEHTVIVNKLMQDKKLLEEGEKLGGLSFIHGVGIKDENDIHVPLPELVGHVFVAGTTRVGKTRAYEILIAQAIKRGDTVIVIDPKGDKDLLNRVVESCRASDREKDFSFFALPYPKFSAHYNPLRNFTLPNEVPDRIAMLLPSGGDSEPFKAFSWQVISIITNAMLYLNIRPNLKNLSTYSLAKTDELCKKCITESFRRHGMYDDKVKYLDEDTDSKVEDYLKLYYAMPEVHQSAVDDLIVLAKHPKEHFQKMIASLTPVLSQLAIGEVGTLLSEKSQNDQDIDWERAVKNKKVIYMLFGSLLMRNTAKAVIRMTIQDFTSFIGSRYCYMENRSPINLFIDEFSEVVDHSFINLLNKAGGAGVRTFLASQSVADIESELKAFAKAQQIFDNLNTKIWLRTTDMTTSKVFSDAAGTVSVKQESSGFSITPDVGESDTVFRSSYSTSSSEKTVPLIDPSWLLKLPKGQGFMISSGRVFKVRVPLLQECNVDYYRERGIMGQ